MHSTHSSMPLAPWGYSSHFHQQFMFSIAEDPTLAGTQPARVIAVRRAEATVTCGTGTPIRAALAGKLLHHETVRPPCVGDFVLLRPPAGGGPGRIEHLLEPTTLLQRKASGTTSSFQAIAANVDLAIIVCGLPSPEANRHVVHRALNPRRIERYLAGIQQAHVRPLIVLNKADLWGDCAELAMELRAAVGAIEVIALSAQTGQGVDELERELLPAMTAVLLGMSGSGKSTLTNRLLGRDAQRIQPVRDADIRGRHTTTERELFELPSGALWIDTPGMREFGLAGAEGDAAYAGSDEIDALAARCRFRDCRHENEPGCAVRAAIEDGALAQERLELAQELEREQEQHRARHEQGAQLRQKQAGKRLSRLARACLRQKYGR